MPIIMHKQTVKKKCVNLFRLLFRVIASKALRFSRKLFERVRVVLIYPQQRITGLQSSNCVTRYQETEFILVLRS